MDHVFGEDASGPRLLIIAHPAGPHITDQTRIHIPYGDTVLVVGPLGRGRGDKGGLCLPVAGMGAEAPSLTLCTASGQIHTQSFLEFPYPKLHPPEGDSSA
jgi:hypothetical protein